MMRNIALLSNVTIDLLAGTLNKKFEIYLSEGYDTWMVEVLDKNSKFYSIKHDVVFLILDGTIANMWNTERQGNEILDSWKTAIEFIAEELCDIPVFISTIDFRENRIKCIAERRYSKIWSYKWYKWLQNLSELKKNIYVFDIADLAADIGRVNFYSEKMWYMGSMPFSKLGIEKLAFEINLLVSNAYEPRKKAIAVDLDNTLWGGVIGEDGIDGIQLSNHNEGQRYFDLQKQLLEMKRRGVLLTIISKNNECDVKTVFKKHPYMLLKEEDFSASRINWNDKPENMKDIENELNLTSGSFIFLDDNPMERELMLEQSKETTVIDFPKDTSQLANCLEYVYNKYFRTLRLTREDLCKTIIYRQESERRKLRKITASVDDYLKNLEMYIDIHKMRPEERERVVQLCNKTNQFNLTSKRYGMTDILKFEHQNDTTIYTVHCKDKYGDNGLVSVIILIKKDDNMVDIDTFLMSCRVMGRKLEYVIMTELYKCYLGSAKVFNGFFQKTDKNAPVQNLYEQLGFTLVKETEQQKVYYLEIKGKMKQLKCYSNIIFEGRTVNYGD